MLTLLFPTPLQEVISKVSTSSTAVCGEYSRAKDGQWYAIKGCTSGEGNLPHPFYVPHSEWFCQHLCEAIGLACPPCRIIQRPSNELVFGSRIEGGLDLSASFGGPKLDWFQHIRNGDIPLDDFVTIFSRLYPFDLFVNNNDRHAGNYLVREQSGGATFLVFDFSNSWLSNGFPPPALPMANNTTTIIVKNQFKQYFTGFAIDVKLALETLDALRAISCSHIETIINSHPQQWLSLGDKDTILNWWQSDRILRLNTIEGGLTSGNYL